MIDKWQNAMEDDEISYTFSESIKNVLPRKFYKIRLIVFLSPAPPPDYRNIYYLFVSNIMQCHAFCGTASTRFIKFTLN